MIDLKLTDRIDNSESRCMKKWIRNLSAAALFLLVTGCATIGGTLVGAGIGAIAGDAKMGAAVGATTGAVIDIFGR